MRRCIGDRRNAHRGESPPRRHPQAQGTRNTPICFGRMLRLHLVTRAERVFRPAATTDVAGRPLVPARLTRGPVVCDAFSLPCPCPCPCPCLSWAGEGGMRRRVLRPQRGKLYPDSGVHCHAMILPRTHRRPAPEDPVQVQVQVQVQIRAQNHRLLVMPGAIRLTIATIVC